MQAVHALPRCPLSRSWSRLLNLGVWSAGVQW